jgi:hypothetical protein
LPVFPSDGGKKAEIVEPDRLVASGVIAQRA